MDTHTILGNYNVTETSTGFLGASEVSFSGAKDRTSRSPIFTQIPVYLFNLSPCSICTF